MCQCDDSQWCSRLAGWLRRDGPRRIPGERWANVLLRAGHLVGVAGMTGALLVGLDQERWLPYWHLTAVTGLAMAVLYLGRSGRWLTQVAGLSMVGKLLPLWLALRWPEGRTGLFYAIIVLSAVVAHAPAPVRHWSLLDRRRRSSAR